MFGRTTQPEPLRPPGSDNVTPTTPAASFFPAQAAAQAAPQPPRTSGSIGPAGNSTSVIAQDLRISGEKIMISCQSRLQVDGDIRGDLAGREIIVGETGSVAGTIAADSVEVRGRVEGAIHGANVSLLKSAQVNGEIVHKSLSITEGAQFDGRVRRAKSDDELKVNL